METNNIFEPNKKSANFSVVVITCVAFFALLLWEKSITKGTFYGNTVWFLLEHGALYGPKVLEGEWYRLITYLFLHSGPDHLINNMLILFFMGSALERYLGKIKYLVLYFSSGILAAIGSIVYNMMCSTSFPVCIGASGAVFGVSGAMACLVLINRGNLEGLTKKQMLVFLGLSVYGGFVSQGVDNIAHITGLLSGFVLAALLYRRKPSEE